ncbi:XtrA/YqaO family protein [Shouchella clausii]|uniref:XtrA/YqaO family protein n=1 Tax=Shouchella clausii TaxID=79880 RepID=UPI000BA55A1C|nr:XtrA/YqaO family protein [Shouchella clausii]PAE96756.1 hypothetical protein CHH71_12155 [Shouchella clausii]
MRLKDLPIDLESGRIELDILELESPCLIVLGGGKAKIAELPAYGETVVVTHQNKVKRLRFEEGEEF